MTKIYVVEDEVVIREEIKSLLERYGYDCLTAEGFDAVPEHVIGSGCDLVLLDINLPMYDGYSICREIRKSSDVPIIMVTSRQSLSDELIGMNLGADDFITKPYDVQILLAHVEAVLRRSGRVSKSRLEHKGVVVDILSGMVCFGESEAELTKNELKILCLLMRNAGTIISRDEIMNELWQSDEFIDDNTLTVNINRLRRKLANIGIDDFLITRRGHGYMV